MRPGVIHSVYSVENCLMVGGHFYTAETMPATIDAVSQQIRNQSYENEAITAQQFDDLTEIMRNVQRRGVFKPKERMKLCGSVAQMLQDFGLSKDGVAPMAKWIRKKNKEPSWITALKRDNDHEVGRDATFYNGVFDFVEAASEWLQGYMENADPVD